MTRKDELTSKDFGESFSCNSIGNKSMIAHLISSQLLQHFGQNEPRTPTTEECTISIVYSELFKDGLKMNFSIPLI